MRATDKDQGQDKSFKVSDEDFKPAMGTIHRPWTVFCVEVAIKPEGVAVRDSKNRAKGILFFTNEEWKCFTDGVRNGEFDPQ
jgi:hypothetical protein